MMKKFQLVLLLCLSSGLLMPSDAKCRKKGGCCMTCPSGWMEVGGRCYLFRRLNKKWCDAETYCIGEGGNLASFHDEAELNTIKSLAINVGNNTDVWLGGFDAVTEGKWLFSDGSICDVSDWAAESPNYPEDEDCMALTNGTIIDAVCTQLRSFICTTKLVMKK